MTMLVAALATPLVHAQAYRLGQEDILEISFWQEPDLNTTVRVGLDGKITLDIVGQIDAAGKTTEELQSDIVRSISRLNKNISQAVVRVQEYHFHHVYVTGEVESPGKLTFEAIPDLWSIINEAGGVTDDADLSRVTIIRGDEAGRIDVVNVSQAISTGTLNALPKVRRKDTIELPRSPLGLPATELGALVERRNVVYVIGAVTTPGPIQFETNVDVLEAIAQAGGPSPNADLKKARVISKDGRFGQAIQIDLERYSKTGSPGRYIVRQEDTIVLPERHRGFFGANLGTMVTVLGAITSAILIYDRISSDDEPAAVAP
jgi:polysaccharide export outer membrane protein